MYRAKYNFARELNLKKPVDISLELSSFCTNQCGYCLDPKTKVLKEDLSWVEIQDLKENDVLIGFDEMSVVPTKRKIRFSVVEKKWNTKKEAVEIITDKGSVIASLDHRFLDVSSRWTYAKNLSIGQKIKFAKEPWTSADFDLDFMRGYLRGLSDGDGACRWMPKNGQRQVWWRIALCDDEPLTRSIDFLNKIGIACDGIKIFSKKNGNYKQVNKIEIRSKNKLDALYRFLYVEMPSNQRSFELGYLSGIFDAEGSYSEVIRISQKNENDVLDRCEKYIENIGMQCVREDSGVRLLGGEWECIKFLGMIRASIKRKITSFVDGRTNHTHAKIINIKKLGVIDLIDIQTSTKTFYGGGFPTHNCYHSAAKELPFKRGFMTQSLAYKILDEAAELGVNSLKFNWRGESTMNPHFEAITDYAKKLASGSTFIDRVTNSNFNFKHENDSIYRGLCNQTKVKVSLDSFRKDIFETQRKGSKYELTIANVNKFYNFAGRDNVLVIQSVRTQLNKDEDLEHEIKSRWPSAQVSIRDVVEDRVNRNLDNVILKKRDSSERQSCIQFHARLIVGHDGIVSGCCPDIKQQIKIGDCNVQTIGAIWNSDYAKKYRKMLLDKTAFNTSPCKNCSSFETYKNFKKVWDS